MDAATKQKKTKGGPKKLISQGSLPYWNFVYLTSKYHDIHSLLKEQCHKLHANLTFIFQRDYKETL